MVTRRSHSGPVALRLRGSRHFDERAQYDVLVEKIVGRMNARVGVRLAVERAMLRTLPARRTAEFEEVPARLTFRRSPDAFRVNFPAVVAMVSEVAVRPSVSRFHPSSPA